MVNAVALAVPNVVQIDARRTELATAIKARLAQPSISVQEARDGIRDCFVSSYLGGAALALDGFGIRGQVDSVVGVVSAMFKRRLEAKGSSFEAPTLAHLQALKTEVDDELRLDELPPELKGVHDQVCSVLLHKATPAAPKPHRIGDGVRVSVASLFERAAARMRAGQDAELALHDVQMGLRLMDTLRELEANDVP
jgi:hypothetical protein